jgi:hypothetical protein
MLSNKSKKELGGKMQKIYFDNLKEELLEASSKGLYDAIKALYGPIILTLRPEEDLDPTRVKLSPEDHDFFQYGLYEGSKQDVPLEDWAAFMINQGPSSEPIIPVNEVWYV